MRLLIVGTLRGQLTLATKLAMDKGATVTHADDAEMALRVLRSGRSADLLMVEVAIDIRDLIARLEAEPDWSAAALERVYRATVEALSLKLVDLAQLSRLAVTGGTASPPLFEVLALLGRDEVLRRLRRARGVAEGRG